jgi:hypothetical protein
MKYIVTYILFTFFSLISYSQYTVEIELDTVTNNEQLVLLHNGKKLDVEISEDENWGFLYVKNDIGKVAVLGSYNLEKIHWLDSIIHPDLVRNGDYFYDQSLILTKSEEGYGLINYYTQEEVLASNNDSIFFIEEYDESVEIYKGGKKAIFPLSFMEDSKLQNHLKFYNEIGAVSEYFNYAWEAENTYLYKENEKYGVIRYAREYFEDGTEFHYIEVIPCEMDSIYILENTEDYVIVEKDELKGVINPYVINDSSEINIVYSEIYFDEGDYELVKIASVKSLQKKFPEIESLEVLDPSYGLVKLISKDGVGLYWDEKDTLLFQMDYQEITLFKNKLEFKKDNKYGYVDYKWFDYGFVGVYDNPHYLYDSPLNSSFFRYSDTAKIYYQQDSIEVYSNYDKEKIVLPHSYSLEEKPLDDLLKGITGWEEQRKVLFDYVKNYKEEYVLYNLSNEVDNIQYNREENKVLILYANSWEEIDSLILAHNINKYSNPRVEVIGKGENMPRDFYPDWKMDTYSFNNSRSTRFVFDGKMIYGDHCTYTRSGYFSVFKNGKTRVYNKKGELIRKLKKDRVFLYGINDYLSIEKWSYGDSVATYQILNPKGKVVLEKQKSGIDINSWGDYNKSFRVIIDSNQSLTNDYPLDFVKSSYAEQCLIQTNNCFPCDSSVCIFKREFFDLNGSKLQIDEIEEETDKEYMYHNYFLTLNTTPRAIFKGIHTGDEWLIPMEYDYIETGEVDIDGVEEEVFKYFKVGYKNIFNLFDLEGNKLLKDNFYVSKMLRVKNNELSIDIIPEGKTEFETIKITLKR